jgi:uncharacterized membrane protein YeaQ/YmgE (transglycosylase-associated protein family)
MNIIAFLLVGLVVGWLAGQIVDGHGFGVGMDIVVGIVGSFVGGLISDRLIGPTYGYWATIGMSTLGAIILLLIARLISNVGTRPHAP